MTVDWRLREVLASQGIGNAAQLKTALEETLGVGMSRMALSKLMRKQPAHVRMETAQILCNLLQLPLEAFLRVEPEPMIRHPGGIIKPYGKPTVSEDDLLFTDPGQFF